jgi:2-(3-amino-3-carboxypropyl)histidine synthase
VPIDMCTTNVLYVFVDIKFDLEHFVQTVKYNFEAGTPLLLVSTIQFAASLNVSLSVVDSYINPSIQACKKFPHSQFS